MGAGLISGTTSNLIHWAWAASAFAILTAYVRVLGTSVGLAADFSGPMAKQHRMFLITVSCIVTSVELYIRGTTTCMYYVLILITLGSIVTSWRRLTRIYKQLVQRGHQ